jgi:hypothetical protein
VVLFWPAFSFGGTVLIGVRFNVFWLPLLIGWLRPEPGRMIRPVLVAGTVALAALLTLRFSVFDEDASRYEALEPHIPMRSCLRPIIFLEPDDDDAFVHLPVWTQARKGGRTGWSFASNFPTVARYRADAPELMKRGGEWVPARFDWRQEMKLGYDAYVVRSPHDRTQELFAGAPVRLVARSGRWWLYRP